MDSNNLIFLAFIGMGLYVYMNGAKGVTKYVSRRSIERPYIDARQYLSTGGIPLQITSVKKETGSYLGIPRYFANTARGEKIILYQ